MSDIVERLHFLGTGEPFRGPLMGEAAIEIDRLRARVAELERKNDAILTRHEDEADDWIDENETLREKLAILDAECASLKAERDSWRDLAQKDTKTQFHGDPCAIVPESTIEEWEAERQRLRAALEAAPEPTNYGAGDWLDWLIDLKDWFRTTRAEALK